jgi:hypothetical protein
MMAIISGREGNLLEWNLYVIIVGATLRSKRTTVREYSIMEEAMKNTSQKNGINEA